MNWRKEAVNDLRSYPQRKQSLDNIAEHIKTLDERFRSLKMTSFDTPVMGGGSKQEEAWINNIAERESLTLSLEIARNLVELTEKGLEVLDKRERRVLELFYITPCHNHIDRLCDELNFEKTRIYEIKDSALRKFTIAMYGIVEL